MADAFQFAADSISAPARKALAITPADGADLADVPKALWVAAAGTVSIVSADDVSNAGVSLGSLAVGTVIPIRCRRVRSTGTTATLLGLY